MFDLYLWKKAGNTEAGKEGLSSLWLWLSLLDHKRWIAGDSRSSCGTASDRNRKISKEIKKKKILNKELDWGNFRNFRTGFTGGPGTQLWEIRAWRKLCVLVHISERLLDIVTRNDLITSCKGGNGKWCPLRLHFERHQMCIKLPSETGGSS